MKKFLTLIAVIAITAFTSQGQISYFDALWSGAPNGNGASAYAVIGIDTTLIPNPGSYINSAALPSWLSSITLTVSGASSGNGTFTLSDFKGMVWNTYGATLNLGTELVGQTTPNYPWGTPAVGTSGDFNFFNAVSSPTAPNGVNTFELKTAGGAGDLMNLTSFQPAPEPSTLALAGLGGSLLLLLRRHRK